MTALFLLAMMAMPAADGPCYATARAVAPGTILTPADIEPVPCKSAARPPLCYDRASSNPVASAALPAGTYLGRLAPVAEEQVPAGAELTLRSSAGAVTIERRVTAMQAGRAGGRIFVRDPGGEVFAVPLAASTR